MASLFRAVQDMYHNGYPDMIAFFHGYNRPEFYYTIAIVLILLAPIFKQIYFPKKIVYKKKWAGG